MMSALAIFVVSFSTMEFVAYLAHRFVYHGLLWVFHKSHHTPRQGLFELNDLFPLFFAAVSVVVFWLAAGPPVRVNVIAGALGVTIYGMVYSFFHDIYIHRRMPGVVFRCGYLQRMKRAHMVHHATGGEPYGLLFFREKDLTVPSQSGQSIEDAR